MDACRHNKSHTATVAVQCFEDTGTFLAEIKIVCAECGRPFQFVGLKLGLDLNGAAMDVDGQEARLAIAPVGTIPQPLDSTLLAGFRVRQPGDN